MNSVENRPCASCHQDCCHDYTVTVTGYDVWCIANHLRLDPHQFLVCFLADKPDSKGFKLGGCDKKFEIALATRKIDGAVDKKQCVFWLSLLEGYGRCGIYEVRPLVCQTYPAYLSHGLVHLRTDALCPERSWNLSTMDLPYWRQRLLRFHMETDIYSSVIEQWNSFVDASPTNDTCSVDVFYGYLIAVYSRIERARQNVSPEEVKLILKQWGECTDRAENPLQLDTKCSDENVKPIWSEFLMNLRDAISNSICFESEADRTLQLHPSTANTTVPLVTRQGRQTDFALDLNKDRPSGQHELAVN